MEARRLIENARYDPSQLKALAEAFDRAWERIAPSFGTRSADMEAARLQLAGIILSFATKDVFDSDWLADTAVLIMETRL
jgi:hypothetical protein